MALDKGAQAVIFDVSDDADAAAEVSAKDRKDNQGRNHWNVTFMLVCGSLLVFRAAAKDRLPPSSCCVGRVQ